MSHDDESPGCVYTHLENGIHAFRFVRADHAAVDQWFTGLVQANAVTPKGETQRVLMDLRASGLPPIRYMVSSGRKFFAENPNQPTRVRSAYLVSPSVLVSIAQSLLATFRQTGAQRRFFDVEDESVAIDWLLEE